MEVHAQAEEALVANEVPVGCVFVLDGRIVGSARNRTNELRNVSMDALSVDLKSLIH